MMELPCNHTFMDMSHVSTVVDTLPHELVLVCAVISLATSISQRPHVGALPLSHSSATKFSNVCDSGRLLMYSSVYLGVSGW